MFEVLRTSVSVLTIEIAKVMEEFVQGNFQHRGQNIVYRKL